MLYTNFPGNVIDAAKWYVNDFGGLVQDNYLQMYGNGSDLPYTNGVTSKNFFERGMLSKVRISFYEPTGRNNTYIALQKFGEIYNDGSDNYYLLPKDYADNIAYYTTAADAYIVVDGVQTLLGTAPTRNVVHELSFEFVGSSGVKVSVDSVVVWEGEATATDKYSLALANEYDMSYVMSVSCDLVPAEMSYDSFAGTTLDTDKWTVIQQGSGTITQNNQLAIVGDGSINTTGLISKRAFVRGEDKSVTFKIVVPFPGYNMGVVSLQQSNTSLSFGESDIIIVYNYFSGIVGVKGSFSYDGGINAYVVAEWDTEFVITIMLKETTWDIYINGLMVGSTAAPLATTYYASIQHASALQTFLFKDVSYDVLDLTTNIWKASSAGVWSNAANWSLGHKPTTGEDIVFDGTGIGDCTVDEAPSISSFTMSDQYTGTFDDAGYAFTLGTSVLITPGGMYRASGTWTMTGDGDFILNNVPDQTQATCPYDCDLLDVTLQGSGKFGFHWYDSVDNTGKDIGTLTCAYPGKTTRVVSWSGFVSKLVGGSGTIYVSGYLENSFNFGYLGIYANETEPLQTASTTITWDDTNDPFAQLGIFWRNQDPIHITLPVLDIGSHNISFGGPLRPALSGFRDVQIDMAGALSLGSFSLNTSMGDFTGGVLDPGKVTFKTNGYVITSGASISIGCFLPAIEIGNPERSMDVYFGSSTVSCSGSFTVSEPGDCGVNLYLENSTINVLGQSLVDKTVWDVGGRPSLKVFPGSSTVNITVATDTPYNAIRTSDACPFHNLSVTTAPLLDTAITGSLNVGGDFTWSADLGGWDSTGRGLNLTGTGIVTLNNNFQGRLWTRTPGQVIIWETVGGSVYTIDNNSIGDIGGSSNSAVAWQSATPNTPYDINATVAIDAGSLNISDCNNSGTVMRVARAGSTDGGRNTGITFISSSTFSQPSVPDGSYVSSTLDKTVLTALIQGSGPDSYFDSPSKIKRVIVYYTHTDGRQFQYAVFEGDTLTGDFGWGASALDGVWVKNKVVAFDANNAKVTLTNLSSESLVHASGAMTLNTN